MRKKWQDLRIVFMGTPEFAVASLEALLQAGANVVGVVTAVDKAAGRGLQLNQSAVKKYAAAKKIPLLQPPNLKSEEFQANLAKWKADVQVVVAFRMLPEAVWNMPPMGTINVHASLLPQYRGAAPINWAVINGEPETGVTTFLLQHAIDTGNILLQSEVPIGPKTTAGELHDTLMVEGAKLLVKTLEQLGDGTLTPTPQKVEDPSKLRHAPKIETDTCRIDWFQPVEKIYNQIRGLSPYPTAFTQMEMRLVKIFEAEMEIVSPSKLPDPGSYMTNGKFLKFTAIDGYIVVKDLQLDGKKRMKVDEFLRGFRPRLRSAGD
ncbi:MAG TPA: methionyl-tRNA formyltransferase [Dinghuibacter sp.]|jgi:methionyl-tRNA formyltransferase|uniref:methionyl-tRNA formyltransferase n=1 Tax=Dinghuibacter sp. TaxID=2024697 RepID=UPI002BB86CD2|nr:methionyl-tRNA formyltransferase [Dinghuibacter sp.]HTJ12735.1 methionyl-tRNA formyltransferase [Dinghuibacter sp.]